MLWRKIKRGYGYRECRRDEVMRAAVLKRMDREAITEQMAFEP